MGRLIDADVMKQNIRGNNLNNLRGAISEWIDKQPTVDAVPVVHARWTTERIWRHDGEWYCSVCEYEPIVFMESNYCPHCGAKMDGDTE